VKLRGYRIELGEIEQVISRCSQVRTCAVGVTGEAGGSEQLVAYVVLEADTQGDWEQAFQEVKQVLPEYMIPSAVVVVDALPLTVSGKVDRQALAALAVKEQKASYVEPRTEAEKQLVEIWQEVLALKEVGVEDNFFAIGGHSLQITRVLARVHEVFDVWLSVRSMFKNPTIAGMAVSIQDVQVRSSTLRKKLPAPISRETYRQKRVTLIQDRQNN
jgi:AMP-binding enzyme/phosphopantetheine binding protein